MSNTLASGASLRQGSPPIVSNNGTYILKVSNGLVFLDNHVTGQRLWVKGQLLQPNAALTMQADGNLVFSEGNPSIVVWSSGTSGYPGAYAVLGDNGNLVIYDVNNEPIWSLGTAQGPSAAIPAALVEIRTSLENALAKHAILERAFVANNVAAAAARDGEASVNVRNYNANAE